MQNLQSPGDLLFNVSASSEPIQGTWRNQGNQSPRSSTQLAGGGKSSAMHQNKANHALHIAGAVLENGLKTLK